MTSMQSQIRGVLLDVDGTLVDTNAFHAEAWRLAFEEIGLHFSKEKIQNCIGMGGDHLLPVLSGIEKESEKGKKLSERRAQIYEEEFSGKIKPFPGVKELISLFRNQGLKLSIVTSGKKKDLEKVLSLLNIEGDLDAIVTSDDVEHSKPDPDLVIAGQKKLGLSAGEVLMLGDTPYDIQAAQAASVKTVAFRCGGWSDEALASALKIYDHPNDLVQNFSQSPFASKDH